MAWHLDSLQGLDYTAHIPRKALSKCHAWPGSPEVLILGWAMTHLQVSYCSDEKAGISVLDLQLVYILILKLILDGSQSWSQEPHWPTFWINIALEPHQTYFFLHQIEASTEIHNWPTSREDSWPWSAQSHVGVSVTKPPYLQQMEHCRMGHRDNSWETVPYKHGKNCCTHEISIIWLPSAQDHVSQAVNMNGGGRSS